MSSPEIKITFKSDSSNVEKDLDRIEQKIEKMPKRIPLGQGTWNPNGPNGPNGPKNPQQEEYKAGYKAMQDELAALSERYSELEKQTEKLTASYRQELAALDENAQGYAEQKKALEDLIAKGEGYEKTLASQKVAVEKMTMSSQQLNKKVSEIGYEKAIQEQDKMGLSLGVMQKQFDQTEQQISNYAEVWSNKVAKANEKAIKSEEKYQDTLELTGLTYQELTQLYSQLLAQRQRGDLTQGQLQKIDRQLTAVRNNITLIGRETQLSGAKMIGAQTSVMGVFHQVVNQWRNGTLTLRGLTLGIKLFAKSTVVLAAIQLAWEGISWALDKAKAAFFGTAEAEEKAAEKTRDLARASKEASENLDKASSALTAFLADKKRTENARAYAEAIAEQNQLFKDQLSLISEVSQEILFQQSLTAKDEELRINIEKEQLHRKKMLGLIEEHDYQEKMLELTERQAKLRAQGRVDTAKVKADEARQKAKTLRSQAETLGAIPLETLGATPEEISRQIALIKRDSSIIAENENIFDERDELAATLKDPKKLLWNFLKDGAITQTAQIAKMQEYKNRLNKLNKQAKALEKIIDRNNARIESLPELIKEAESMEIGLENYKKDFEYKKNRNKTNKDNFINKQKEAQAAEVAADKADDALAKENMVYSQTVTELSKLNAEKLATIQAQREIEKGKKKTEQILKKARERVVTLEMDELRKREKDALFDASNYGEKTIEGSRAKALANVYRAEWRRRSSLQKAAKIEGKYEGNTKDALALASGGAYAMLSDGKLTGSEIESMLKTLRTKNNIQNENLHRLLQEIIAIAISNKMITQKTFDKYKNDLKSAKLNFIDK